MLKKLQYVTLAVVYIATFCAFFAISLSRLYSFQLFYFDYGIFADILWQASQFKVPYIDHLGLGHVIFLGDHFNPSILLLSPLYWFLPDMKVLLVEQAAAAALSGFMIYSIGRKLKLSFSPSLVISLIFLLFAGTQNPLVTDWHPETTAGLFLLLFFYVFVFTKKSLLAWICALVFLGFKESNAVTLSFLLMSLFFLVPKKRKEIGLLFALSVAWFVTTVRLLIPYFAKQPYMYTPEMPTSVPEILTNLTHHEKLQLIWKSFLSFAFLPLLGGPLLIPIVGELLIRFLPTKSFFQHFTLTLHYNVYLGIFLALAALFAWKTILRYIKNKHLQTTLLIFCLLLTLFVSRKVTNTPTNLIINKVFWQQLHPHEELTRVLTHVPKTGSILSQNSLLPHLLWRKDPSYLLGKNTQMAQPDIIFFDLSSGQNPNNFYPFTPDDIIKYQKTLEKNKAYDRVSVDNKNIYLYLKYPTVKNSK